MQIRQIALVARQLAPVQQQLLRLLGAEAGFHDSGVAMFGLENTVLTLGNTFLEVVAPIQEGTTAGRLLDRRGGDGGYMVIVQVADLAEQRQRLLQTTIRIAWEADQGKARVMHLHPADVPGAIASLDQMEPPQSWHWAGDDWPERAARHAGDILAAQINCPDPAATAACWAAAYGQPSMVREGVITLPLENSAIRFVADTGLQAPQLQQVDIVAIDIDAIRAAATAMNLPVKDNSVDVCGVQLNFVSRI
jgi:hypothetical protein